MDAQDRYLASLAQNRTEAEQEMILNQQRENEMSTITTCPTCSCPHQGASCENPGCPESGNVSREAWDAGIAADKAEAEEREQRMHLYGFSFQPAEDVEEPLRTAILENSWPTGKEPEMSTTTYSAWVSDSEGNRLYTTSGHATRQEALEQAWKRYPSARTVASGKGASGWEDVQFQSAVARRIETGAPEPTGEAWDGSEIEQSWEMTPEAAERNAKFAEAEAIAGVPLVDLSSLPEIAQLRELYGAGGLRRMRGFDVKLQAPETPCPARLEELEAREADGIDRATARQALADFRSLARRTYGPSRDAWPRVTRQIEDQLVGKAFAEADPLREARP